MHAHWWIFAAVGFLTVVFGKPGSGKSRYATGKLIEQLVTTTRHIVTNLPLRLGELNAYLQEHHPELAPGVLDRITMLEDDDLGRFWEVRGPDPALGVAYFLDEAHIKFNARDWASVRRECINYLSQHRKMGDAIYAITQSPGNLDKQFRSIAEDFTRLSNGYTRQYGMFKARGRFYTHSFYHEPQGNSEPYHKGTFSLDPDGIAKCYDTAKGIGVHGTTADIGRRAKGIPVLWVFPMALGLGSLCLLVPLLLAKGASAHVSGVADRIRHSTDSSVHAAQSVLVPSWQRGLGGAPKSPQAAGGDSPFLDRGAEPVEYYLGELVDGGHVRVYVAGDGWQDVVSVERGVAMLRDGRRVHPEPAAVRRKRVTAAAAVGPDRSAGLPAQKLDTP